MRLRIHAATLLFGGLSAVAVGGGAGVAGAQPNPPPPAPVIDQLITSTPALGVTPNDEGGPVERWGGVGMFCQNFWIRCR
ncbi:hypothetical protein [Mycolicibacterium chubuense]|nr:hypothetical protein [Mycolicibacterium chubuense]